jgi:hypothetical protein
MSEEKIETLNIISASNSALLDFIESSEKILENCDGYSDINNDYKFRNIKIYGSDENPCFQANCIFDYLFPEYLKNFDQLNDTEKQRRKKTKEKRFTKWVDENFINVGGYGKDNDIYKANIKKNESDNRSYKSYVLTETGLLTAFCSGTKSKLARIFRNHLVCYINNIKKYHIDVHIQELERSEKLMKQKYEDARDRYQEAEHLNKRNIQIQEAFINPDDTDVQNHTELTILRRENMRQYFVYLVDWKYVNTKYWKTFPQKDQKKPTTNAVKKSESKSYQQSDGKYEGIDLNSSDSDTDDSTKKITIKKKIVFDDSEPHPDGLQEEYDLYDINLQDMKNNENEDYYIYISSKEIHHSKKKYFKFLRFMYVKDTKHYKEMMDYIANGKKYSNDTAYVTNNDLPDIEYIPYHVETSYKGVYQLNYSNLIDARNSSFINLYKATLDLHKKEKRDKRKQSGLIY